MTSLGMRASFDSTSAAGAMLRRAREPVRVGFMLAGVGTSTAYVRTQTASIAPPPMAEQTTAGAPVVIAQAAGAAIGELRRISGLTWDQLARLFNVSRRALHFWASGKPMASTNEEHLQRLLVVVRRIDRGSASDNRAALLAARAGEELPFDLLVEGKYEQAVAVVGPRDARRVAPAALSSEAKAARAPRPPDELVDALQDRIHRDGGAVRAAKSVRTRSGR